MKKILLLSFIAICSILSQAQTIESLLDGAAFSMTSPNGVYLAGNMEDAAVYYNSETKRITVLEGEFQDDGGCFVWDMNDKGQLAIDWKNQAAIWSEAKKFEVLSQPKDLTSKEKVYSATRCISNDGKYLVVSFGNPTTAIYLYIKGEDGEYTMEKLPLPEVDPIYNQTPQFIAPCGITDDAKRILMRFVVETAEFELPFILEATPEGDWTTRWVAAESIVKGGKTDAVFYGIEFETDSDPFEDPEGYEADYNEWLAQRDDYYATINAVSTGYFFQRTMGDLSNLSMSANGKYAKMNISYKDLTSKEEDIQVENYPAVIDLETEQLYVFTCLEDAGCLSVTNDGMVSLATPKVEYFRYGHISSIADPTKSQTLTEWTKEKTNGVIDLAQYMTYTDYSGQSLLAEGGAIFSADGGRFMTCQYNGFGDNSRYEIYIVNLGKGESTDTINQAVLKYCSDEIVSACGNEYSQDEYAQSAAIKITEKQLKLYEGNYVVKMSVGLAKHEQWTPTKVSGLKFWIRKTLTGENLWEQDYEVEKIVFGEWNELVFDNFYSIDGSSDLYFGYTINCGGLPIGGDGNSDSPNDNAIYVYDVVGSNWITYKYCGNFSIKVVISGDKMPKNNLAINALRTAEFVRTDSKFDAVANISNTVDNDVTSFDFVVYNGATELYRKTISLNEPLKNGEFLDMFFEGIQCVEEGVFDITYTLENINGNNKDDNESDSKLVKKTYVSNKFEDKVVMLEMFFGTMDPNSPSAYTYLNDATEKLGTDKYVWAIHHAGYNASEFTVNESYDAVAFYGASVTYTPGVMFDRVNLLNVGVTSSDGANGPVFSVNEAGSRGVLESYMNVIQKNMSPIELNVHYTIGEESRELEITVEGKLLGDFEASTLRIGVITIEDSIIGTQAGVSGKYIHNHIIRSFLTSAYGDNVSVSDGSFVKNFTTTLKDKFVLDNMRLAVWVGKDTNTSDINGFEIYQAYQKDLLIKLDNPDEPEYPIEPEIFTITTGSENANMGGVKITLTAEPIEGFEFVEWTDGVTDNPRTLELTEDIEVYARFKISNDINVNIETSKIQSANVYGDNGVLHVDGVEGDYYVLDTAGRLVYSGHDNMILLPRGVYIVTIASEVQKIIL